MYPCGRYVGHELRLQPGRLPTINIRVPRSEHRLRRERIAEPSAARIGALTSCARPGCVRISFAKLEHEANDRTLHRGVHQEVVLVVVDVEKPVTKCEREVPVE